MTEETVPLIPLSDHDNKGEGSNQTASPSNKHSKKQISERIPKKDSVLLDNKNAGAECLVKKTDEQLYGKVYSSGNSTSNLIAHLAGSYQITENTNVKLHLCNAMELYWNKEEKGVLILAILDSRIKCLGFVDEEIRNKTKDLLKSKYDQLKADFLSTMPTILLPSKSSLFSIFK
ncbi:13687_t:CDS:2 [Funneliformis caledonium]|uniref:13687_t:CDS:1 n=1 Tax=Funneliformis caledonium TaxID=1117310 RepID=A0A9N9H358_9GLOM|nr:13687_t:CDS:2 [Funneliformis caledonium]